MRSENTVRRTPPCTSLQRPDCELASHGERTSRRGHFRGFYKPIYNDIGGKGPAGTARFFIALLIGNG